MSVKAKKHLGQHFLTDPLVAQSIAETLAVDLTEDVLEIGPGTGVLTKFLLENKKIRVHVIEIDKESVKYLNEHLPELEDRVLSKDFLQYDLVSYFKGKPFSIIGNFPYNISTQIVFRLLELKAFVPQFSGMFQKEVAQRICSKPGSKVYGILSVLVQAYYEAEYLFTVDNHVFNPPPKVQSGVLKLTRRSNQAIGCDPKLFRSIVKMSFNQRRKTIRNSLKSLLKKTDQTHELLAQRPEQLSVSQFVELANWVQEYGASSK